MYNIESRLNLGFVENLALKSKYFSLQRLRLIFCDTVLLG